MATKKATTTPKSPAKRKKTATNKTKEVRAVKTAKDKERMIEALTKSLGIVTNAVKVTGISRTTHYAWMEKDPEYRSRVEEATDAQIDFVEGNLIQRIQEGDTTATIFYLKTKGKKRGYTERMEIAPAEGTTMSFYQMLMMTGEANDDEDEADES